MSIQTEEHVNDSMIWCAAELGLDLILVVYMKIIYKLLHRWQQVISVCIRQQFLTMFYSTLFLS